MTATTDRPVATVDDVLITPELTRRAAREPDHAAESRALVELATVMADSPKTLFQKLADSALELCNAGSAGVSVWEPNGKPDVFRWRATAGEYASYLGGTMPRDFSPCGTVLDRNCALLMADPVRFYPYISGLCSPVREVLLVPFYQDGRAVGTVWVVSHSLDQHFDAEDARVITSLTRFAGAAVQTLTRIEEAEKTDEALRQLAADLAEAGRRKDEFLATLAHELRNPLAPIRNALAVLRVDRPDAKGERLVGMMERQVGQLVRMVDDLLDVSRVSSGKVTLNLERVAVRTVVEAAIETSRPLIETAGHEMSLHLPTESVFVDGDPARLIQVVTNLLNNAAKYTPARGKVQVAVARDGAEAVIQVIDSGVGIPKELLPRVFDVFMQVGESLDRAQGGLGLGLTLVRKLTEMHGGTVTAESAGENRGSTFVVRLPVANKRAAPRSVQTIAQSTLSALRVLVVDDNEDGADSLATLLEMKGHEVRTAYTGPSGLATAQEFRPEVVLLDIGLPGLNGYEVAERLRRDATLSGLFLVALTGRGTEDDRKRAQEAGFDAHLTKPVESNQVSELLAKLPRGS